MALPEMYKETYDVFTALVKELGDSMLSGRLTIQRLEEIRNSLFHIHTSQIGMYVQIVSDTSTATESEIKQVLHNRILTYGNAIIISSKLLQLNFPDSLAKGMGLEYIDRMINTDFTSKERIYGFLCIFPIPVIELVSKIEGDLRS